MNVNKYLEAFAKVNFAGAALLYDFADNCAGRAESNARDADIHNPSQWRYDLSAKRARDAANFLSFESRTRNAYSLDECIGFAKTASSSVLNTCDGDLGAPSREDEIQLQMKNIRDLFFEEEFEQIERLAA